MPLTYLLYRCPRCGHDPMVGKKDDALCPSCGTSFSRGGEGGLIRVQESSGGVWELPGHLLTAAMERRPSEETGSPTASPTGSSGESSGGSSGESSRGFPWIRRAEVRVRRSGEEAPVRWGGSLLGFAEAMGEPTSGFLGLSDEELALWMGETSDFPDHQAVPARRWPLMEVRAVQTSSSCLQFSPKSGGLVEFRFPKDSPFRWESLLRNALGAAYQREGLGEIVEFQPRIVVEP
jgi:hypothetical protein